MTRSHRSHINHRSKQKHRKDSIKNAAILLLIALHIFNGKSELLSTLPRELMEAEIDTREPTLPVIAKQTSQYEPSRLENRIMERHVELGYHRLRADECDLFHNTTRSDFYQEYHDYVKMLDNYSAAVKKFDVKLDDLRLVPVAKRSEICESMDDVLKGAFETDVALSKTREGYVEPLLPPLRHPRFCEAIDDILESKDVLNLDYLVHDFGLMCRQLNSTSRTVFIDLGASLDIHPEENPSLRLVNLYQKFGIKFDHYYAFEATPIPGDQVYPKVPKDLLTAFHWFNVPVEVQETSMQNPWNAIVSQFDENDLVVVKLDIDTARIEIPLVYQLIRDKNARIVDHFYFEHHVRMKNMLKFWRATARGELIKSLDLFTKLRKAGIAAHSWV